MKRIAMGILSLSLMLGLSLAAMAQDSQSAGSTNDKKVQKAENKEAKAASKGKAVSVTGWVKSEGDKVTFVNDKDKQTYTVQNADVLKPHDGKHVKAKATLDPTAKTMTVESVKDMSASKQAKGAKTSATQ